jgi:hypothetical protein
MAETVLPQDPLVGAISEYTTGLLTPELIDATWQTVWNSWGNSLEGHRFEVPSCDRSALELEELKQQGRHVLLVPDEVMTPEGLVLLGKLIPHKSAPNGILWGESAIREITNYDNRGGTIDVEMRDNPNPNLTEAELKRLFDEQGRTGQRLSTYIIGSLFSRLLTGKPFDSNFRSSRLLGSSYDNHGIGAVCAVDGTIVIVPNLYGGIARPYINGRSEGRKAA